MKSESDFVTYCSKFQDGDRVDLVMYVYKKHRESNVWTEKRVIHARVAVWAKYGHVCRYGVWHIADCCGGTALTTLRQSVSRRGLHAKPEDYEYPTDAETDRDLPSPGTTVEMRDSNYTDPAPRVDSMSAEEEYQELDIASCWRDSFSWYDQ